MRKQNLSLFEAVKKALYEYDMLPDGENAVVAVSGGADGMALLHCLARLRPGKISGAHVQHGIRGASAVQDMEFVAGYCKAHGIPLRVFEVDVPLYAKQNGIGIEQAARELRYSCLDEAMVEAGASCIAVGHHMDDQAETMLMHLMRGGGPAGLMGMRPVSGNIIRPMLFAGKADILEYCRENGIPFVTDETNYDTEYTRNAIRHRLMPELMKFNPGITAALQRTSLLMARDNDCLEKLALEVKVDIAFGEVRIKYDVLDALHIAVASRVVIRALAAIGLDKDVEMRHIEAVFDMPRRAGASVDIVRGYIAAAGYGELILTQRKDIGKVSVPLICPGDTRLGGVVIRAEVIDSAPEDFKTHGAYVEYFDFNSFPKDAVFRNRRDGDWMRLLGSGTKKLKDYLSDAKIERHIRDRLPVIASGGEILWIIGIGSSGNYRVEGNTQKVLKIVASGNKILAL
ncbi:MAG: tRNA lysidine(34) synthetase TilS [Christensenellales bacterium]|jgi:tRNA(Ile)-lysidine synthase